jgi:hypothetical protein
MKKLFVIILSLCTISAFAQTKKEVTNKIVPEKNYVFVATTAIPMNSVQINSVLSKMVPGTSANNINIDGSGYDVKVVGDSIIAYLPYYGISYASPRNGTDGGIKFTSTKNSYTSDRGKRGDWKITIFTKDIPDNPRLDLNISQNGYASLVVVTTNKQSISYSGYLKELN